MHNAVVVERETEAQASFSPKKCRRLSRSLRTSWPLGSLGPRTRQCRTFNVFRYVNLALLLYLRRPSTGIKKQNKHKSPRTHARQDMHFHTVVRVQEGEREGRREGRGEGGRLIQRAIKREGIRRRCGGTALLTVSPQTQLYDIYSKSKKCSEEKPNSKKKSMYRKGALLSPAPIQSHPIQFSQIQSPILPS